LKSQKIQKVEERRRILETNKESKLRQRKGKGIDSGSVPEAIHPATVLVQKKQEPEKKSQMEKELEQEEILVEEKVERKGANCKRLKDHDAEEQKNEPIFVLKPHPAPDPKDNKIQVCK
jgi:hypothetical protein